MPGPSKVIVVSAETGAAGPDARAARQLLLGFAREGVTAELGEARMTPADTALVVVGGSDARALDVLRRARQRIDDAQLVAPLVFTGTGVGRADAEAAGADEILLTPAYLRDVVTIGRILKGLPATNRAHIVGNLAETTGVYTLVRAFAALGRSAVLTLIRGLRRGEVRFYKGEVTSAQVGVIHGQAALHQLLLWTEARFEYHHEDVVRRQQIPLTHEELFADAERFLEGVRDSSGQLSPSMVLEQDVARINSLAKQVPTEVHGVLRMFDGHRVLADVLEDSPYRVFETLRVTQRAVDVGLLRIRDGNRPKATWRAVLAIEEWLVGSDRDAAIERARTTISLDTGPVPREAKPKFDKSGKRKRKKRRANTPIAVATGTSSRPDIDWGALVPRVVGQEVGSLSGVVPAAQRSGEIQLPRSREAPREKLEALMDTEKREKIFPTEIGLEPSVVVGSEPEPPTAPATPAEPTPSQLVKDLARGVEDDHTTPFVRDTIETPPVTVAETPIATVTVHDTLSVTGSAGTAIVTSTPVTTITEAAPPADAPSILTPSAAEAAADAAAASMIATPVAAPAPAADVPAPSAAPTPLDDEPSDGVVRSFDTVESVPLPRPPPVVVPPDDRPEAKTGEITSGGTPIRAEPRAEEASILVAEPSILVADLGAAQAAVAAVATAQAAAPPTVDASPTTRDSAAEVRKDAASAAAAFTDAEEAFFRAGTNPEGTGGRPLVTGPIETFDDLDVGYEKVSFWDRLRGKKPPPK